jgi:hypothetical protein
MSKRNLTEGPSDREDHEVFKESLARTGEAMLSLAQSLDASGVRPLDAEEIQLLRSAIIGMFDSAMREVKFWTIAGSIDDAREIMLTWANRLRKLA